MLCILLGSANMVNTPSRWFLAREKATVKYCLAPWQLPSLYLLHSCNRHCNLALRMVKIDNGQPLSPMWYPNGPCTVFVRFLLEILYSFYLKFTLIEKLWTLLGNQPIMTFIRSENELSGAWSEQARVYSTGFENKTSWNNAIGLIWRNGPNAQTKPHCTVGIDLNAFDPLSCA